MSEPLIDPSRRRLGSLGDVGPLAYGLWRFTTDDVDDAARLVNTALDHGLNLIDTADVYGLDYGGSGFGSVEENLGRVLAREPGLRDRMILATKGGIHPPVPYDSSPTNLRAACEASLRRLGVDEIDLYQIHRPDMLTHPADVAATLTALRDEGKVREIGISNHTATGAQALQRHLGFAIVTNQVEYSVLHLDPLRDGNFDWSMAEDVTPLIWSPLAGGRLATSEGVSEPVTNALADLASDYGSDPATVALAFTLAHPSRPVAIIGTQQPERIRQSLQALNVNLDRAAVYRLIQASEGRPLP